MAGEGRNQLRVGLLGAGYIAPFHAEAVRRSRVGELACVCDRSLERAKTLYRKPPNCENSRGLSLLFGISFLQFRAVARIGLKKQTARITAS